MPSCLLRTLQEVADLFKIFAQDLFFAGVAQDVGGVQLALALLASEEN